jgi:hypothetical protein
MQASVALRDGRSQMEFGTYFCCWGGWPGGALQRPTGATQGQLTPAIAPPSLYRPGRIISRRLTRSSAGASAGQGDLPGSEAGHSARRKRAAAGRTGPAAEAAEPAGRRTGSAAAGAGARSHPEQEERRRAHRRHQRPAKQRAWKRDLWRGGTAGIETGQSGKMARKRRDGAGGRRRDAGEAERQPTQAPPNRR